MSQRARAWLVSLLTIGLLGHVLAAHLNGGSFTAYWHHIAGFFGVLAVTSVVILIPARLFWRERRSATLLAIGAVQAILGAVVVCLAVTTGR